MNKQRVNVAIQTKSMTDMPDFTAGDSNCDLSDEFMALLASYINEVRAGSEAVAACVRQGEADPMDVVMNPGGKAWSVKLVVAAERALHATNVADLVRSTRALMTSPEAVQTFRECAAVFSQCVEEMRGLWQVTPVQPVARDAAVKMKRAIRVAAVATALNMRSTLLLKRLRARGFTVGGPKGSYVAEYDDLRAAINPGQRKAFKNWADKYVQPED